MTPYEICRLLADPFLPLLHGKVRRELKRLWRTMPERRMKLLDVGGRKSPYTIGLPVAVTITDIPRQSEVQESLNLGLNQRLLEEVQRRRSNVEAVVLEDMTQSSMPDASFDGVVCVEVIEHVPADEEFVRQIARILKPGGWLFLTTPNGDYIRNEPPDYNPDHIRHYTRAGLKNLLARHFSSAEVRYGVKTGKYRHIGLGNLSPHRPIATLRAMFCNMISRIESRNLDETPRRTAHLFAVARKMANVEKP